MSETPIPFVSGALVQAGFLAVRYQDQEGVFHRRDVRAETMPYLGKQLDDELIFAESVVCTEVRPDGNVYVMIADTGYLEEPGHIDTDDAQAILRDAMGGVAVDIKNAIPA